MERQRKLLGELLIAKGLITPLQLERALLEQRRTKEFLGAILIKHKAITESSLLGVLSEQFHIPVVSLKGIYIDWEWLKRFSSSLILDYRCFPFKHDEFSVTVAITNPLDAWVISKAHQEAKPFSVRLNLVTKADIEEVIQRYRQHLREGIAQKFK